MDFSADVYLVFSFYKLDILFTFLALCPFFFYSSLSKNYPKIIQILFLLPALCYLQVGLLVVKSIVNGKLDSEEEVENQQTEHLPYRQIRKT